MGAAAVAMGAAIWLLKPVSARAFAFCGDRAGSVVSLGALIAVGVAVYGSFAAVFMPDAARALVRRIRRRRQPGGARA
jgi:small basic protein